MTTLTLKDFDFSYPDDLVAHEPLAQRDASRLLIWDPAKGIRHSQMRTIAQELPEGSLIILNDSRVFPSRIFGETVHGGRVEIMLLEPAGKSSSASTCEWRAIGRPLRKLREGTTIRLSESLECRITSVPPSSAEELVPFSVEFPMPEAGFMTWLESHGYIPLPPYIKRDSPKPAALSSDKGRYQTIYGQQTGSVAAPTAGLHLTPGILDDFTRRGIEVAPVTLHVGGGTFLPVRAPDISQHTMHEERFTVPGKTYERWRTARSEGRKIVAVGTTTFRCMEGFLRIAAEAGEDPSVICDRWLKTDIFIWPKTESDRYVPKSIDGLVTNFHQPQSTLYMLISALLGFETARTVYQQAFSEKYRLFSYGDANLYWFK